jgi:hypothetical protein
MAAAPGTVRAETIRFTEAAGSAAGVYSGSFEVPVGATLIDVIVHGVALWTAGTSATLIVGDTADDNGFYDAVNLKATDLLAGESLSFALSGGKYGADVVPNDATGATLVLGAAGQAKRRMLTTARNLTAKVTTVGTVGTAGITDVTFVYAYTSPMAPTFVAS